MYFNFLQELKKLVDVYDVMEEEQLDYIQEYKDLREKAKQDNNNPILMDATQMINQAQLFYNSLKQDRKELQNHIKYLIS